MSQSAPTPPPRPAPDPAVEAEKRALRSVMRARLAALSTAERAAASAALCAHLEAVEALGRARVLLATLPHRGEPDTTPFLRRWLAEDPYRVLVVPRIVPHDGPGPAVPRMALWTVPSVEAVAPGPLGAPEPDPARGAEPAPPGLRPAVALVPGLAFDRAGGRLGRGGGFFDALLGEWGGGVLAVGVGYDFQVVERVARDRRWDVAVGALATPGGWIVCADG